VNELGAICFGTRFGFAVLALGISCYLAALLSVNAVHLRLNEGLKSSGR
jgi:hypothetical protein